ncbi:MAG TPA: ankyrin repeat domain-containing protein [Bryobacteraceae bacterium]|jgi:ankyrin repeat protein|nr:ankyrin repeat domain-containing protein [Bryobacteraceae bacterium]
MSLALPEKPNLEHLQKQAKSLLRKVQQGEAAALERFRSLVSFTDAATLKLADAQHAIALEYNFATWSQLKEHVETLAREREPGEMLAAAVRASDADRVAHALESHPELKARINEPMTDYGAGMQAMLAAVQRSDRRTIDVLLRAGADINARSRWWAGGVGVLDECSPELAPFLMERGAAVDALAAARLGMIEKLQDLVAADPGAATARGANGQTALHCASSVEIAEYLLAHGADIDARDTLHESTPAQHMLRVVQARHYPKDRQEIARYLVARGCRTDILMAAALGDRRLIEQHLKADPDCIRIRVDEAHFPKQDPRSAGTIYFQLFGPRSTPHMVARDFGHAEIFAFLIERSPQDVKLAQACELGDESAFRALLAARPNLVETLSDEERRSLPDAAQNNNTAAVRLMLAAGWPVDALGEYDLTALGWAAWHGNAEMVREVLRYRPQLELNNCHEVTALGSALHGSENSWHRQTGDYAATVEALLDAGAKAPPVTEDLEASEAAREVLMRYEERSR